MEQASKYKIDVDALRNLANSWRGSKGEITILPQDCKALRLKPIGKPTKAGAVFVGTEANCDCGTKRA